MLLNEDITNFIEILVEEEFDAQGIADKHDTEYIQDLFCITLNQLPPHYVRSTIDVRINLTPEQRGELAQKITTAMNMGHEILHANRRGTERNN